MVNFSRPAPHSKKVCGHIYCELGENEKSNNFFFIHIPKTADTSFRKSLEEKYSVMADYGAESA